MTAAQNAAEIVAPIEVETVVVAPAAEAVVAEDVAEAAPDAVAVAVSAAADTAEAATNQLLNCVDRVARPAHPQTRTRKGRDKTSRPFLFPRPT